MEARVGIEGRPPSALLLRAQFQPDNTELEDSWQIAHPVPYQRPFNARLLKNSLKVRRYEREARLAYGVVQVELRPRTLNGQKHRSAGSPADVDKVWACASPGRLTGFQPQLHRIENLRLDCRRER